MLTYGTEKLFKSAWTPSGMMMFSRVAKIQIGHRLNPTIFRQIHRNPWCFVFPTLESMELLLQIYAKYFVTRKFYLVTPRTSIPSLPPFTLGNQKFIKRMLHSWGLFVWVDYLSHSLRGCIPGLSSSNQAHCSQQRFSPQSSEPHGRLPDLCNIPPSQHTNTPPPPPPPATYPSSPA